MLFSLWEKTRSGTGRACKRQTERSEPRVCLLGGDNANYSAPIEKNQLNLPCFSHSRTVKVLYMFQWNFAFEPVLPLRT